MSNRTFYLVAAVLLLLHLAKAGLFIGAGQPPLFRDSLSYWQMGAQIAGGDLLLTSDPGAYRTPGYPALLAACQAVCGDYALIAATALQQLATVAIAVLTGLICGRLSGNRAGVLWGLGVSLFCISRNCIAAYLLSDILLCLTLTMLLAALLAWFDRPALRWAVAIGLLLGAGMLVKPLLQLAWAPLLLAMAWRLQQLGSLRGLGAVPLFVSTGARKGTVPFLWRPATKIGTVRGLGRHAAGLLVAIAVIVGPWCLHQQLYLGRPFLTRSLGRQLWDACFSGAPSSNRLCPMPLEFADGPNTVRVLGELQGHDVDPHETFRVYGVLREIGHGEIEADALMQAVSLEAICWQPGRFAQTRAYWMLLFWITEAETLHWQADDAERGEFSDGQRLPASDVCSYLGQQTWFSPRVTAWHQAFIHCCWHPRRWIYGAAAVATLWGWIVLLRDPRRRMLGVALGLLFLYFTVTIALFAPPVYRYRMPLEPLMIAIVGFAVLQGRKAEV